MPDLSLFLVLISTIHLLSQPQKGTFLE